MSDDEKRARALLTLIRDSSSVQDDIDAVLAFERRAKAEVLREAADSVADAAREWAILYVSGEYYDAGYEMGLQRADDMLRALAAKLEEPT